MKSFIVLLCVQQLKQSKQAVYIISDQTRRPNQDCTNSVENTMTVYHIMFHIIDSPIFTYSNLIIYVLILCKIHI